MCVYAFTELWRRRRCLSIRRVRLGVRMGRVNGMRRVGANDVLMLLPRPSRPISVETTYILFIGLANLLLRNTHAFRTTRNPPPSYSITDYHNRTTVKSNSCRRAHETIFRQKPAILFLLLTFYSSVSVLSLPFTLKYLT